MVSEPNRLPRVEELHQARAWLLVQLESATTALDMVLHKPDRVGERQALGAHVQQLAMMLAEAEDALDL